MGPDTIQQEPPQFERGRVYRLNLLSLLSSVDTWPEFIIVRTKSEPITDGPNESATLVEIFVVLFDQWQEYIEPLQSSALN